MPKTKQKDLEKENQEKTSHFTVNAEYIKPQMIKMSWIHKSKLWIESQDANDFQSHQNEMNSSTLTKIIRRGKTNIIKPGTTLNPTENVDYKYNLHFLTIGLYQVRRQDFLSGGANKFDYT